MVAGQLPNILVGSTFRSHRLRRLHSFGCGGIGSKQKEIHVCMSRRCPSFRKEHRFVPSVDCDFSGSNRK